MPGLSLVTVAVLFAAAESADERTPAAMAQTSHASRTCKPQFAPLETGTSRARSALMYWRRDRRA